MKHLLLVFIGGGIGSCLRFVIGKALNDFIPNFFLGTFLVNIIGCLLIGLVLGLTYKQQILNQDQALILATGFCGGFTTFSAFAYEGHNLLKTGAFSSLALYFLSSIVIGLVAVIAGLWIARSI